MERRQLLRAAGGIGSALVLAGCTDDGTEPNSPTRSAREPAPRTPSDATGTVGSTVDGLAVDDPDPFVADPDFGVAVTVTNTGERATDPFAYEHELALAADDGVTNDGGVTVAGDSDEVAPDDSARLAVRTTVDGDPTAVTEFDLTLACVETSEGVYCGE